MKSLLITAAIIGAAIAALIIYGSDDTIFSDSTPDVDDAAEDAYKTMNKHIGRVERKTANALDNALG